MNLPNYPCRSTMTGFQSTTTGSLGLIVQTSVSPTVSTVTSHVRRWRRIVLPKPRAFQVADHRQSGRFRWQGWSENDFGDVRSRTQLEVCPKSGEINGDGDGFLAVNFQASNGGVPVVFRQLGWLGYDGRLPSFRSVPISPGEVAGIARSVPVKVAGRVGIAGQIRSISLSFSLTCPFSFLFWKNQLLFFFFFFVHLSLIQIKLMPCPWWK